MVIVRVLPKLQLHPVQHNSEKLFSAHASVTATTLDGSTLSYQWYKDTTNGAELIQGAVGATFNPETDTVGTFSYYCVITATLDGESYFVTSGSATVIIKDSSDFAPVIIAQPESRINCNQEDKITLSIDVLDPPKGVLSYQWYHSIQAIEDEPSAKTKNYQPPTDVNATDSYYCIVTNTVDGKTYTATSNESMVTVALTKYIHAPNIFGQPGSYILDYNKHMVLGGYAAVAKGNSIPASFNVRFEYMDYDTESTVALYHSTMNTYEDAELVENAICRLKRKGGMGTVDGGWYRDYEINPNTAYPTGEHYFYVVITLSPSDKNSTVEPVSTKSDILKIDFTERETTMDGAGTEQNPYIIKTTEHLSEIQKMVADGDSFAGAYFQIANDVSLPTSWTPIGTRDTAFSGNIDGNHKKLTVPAGEKPLLGCINGASVKDLDIYGEQIEGAGLVNDFTGVGLSGSAIVLDNVMLKSGSKTLKSGLVAAGAGNGYASASAGFVMTMAPDMLKVLEPIPSWQKLTIYIIREDWAFGGDYGEDFSLTTTPDMAKYILTELVTAQLESGYASEWPDRPDWGVECTPQSYECGLHDSYCENHYKVCIEEQELPIDDAAVRSLLDNQLRRYFAEQIEGWDELEGLTEQQITEMVAAPNVPQRIRRQLEKNGFLMDSFWESVAKSLFDLVRQYKEKLV